MWRYLHVGILILIVAFGCKRNDAGPAKSDAQSESNLSLTTEKFSDEFTADATAASAKFNGKTVELTGRSSGVGGEKVYLDAGNQRTIICKVPPDAANVAYRTSKGQKLKIRGKFEGVRQPDLSLSDCTITELEPSKVLIVSASELAREFETDSKSANEKYQNCGNFVLTGKVEGLPKTGSLVFRLHTNAKLTVLVGVRPDDHPLMKLGDAVEISVDSALGQSDGVVVLGMEGARVLNKR